MLGSDSSSPLVLPDQSLGCKSSLLRVPKKLHLVKPCFRKRSAGAWTISWTRLPGERGSSPAIQCRIVHPVPSLVEGLELGILVSADVDANVSGAQHGVEAAVAVASGEGPDLLADERV